MTIKNFIILILIPVALIFIFLNYTNDDKPANMNTKEIQANIQVTPIEHATMVLNWNGKVIYTDPVGDASLFAAQPKSDIVLITDIHGDHFDLDTLKSVIADNTAIIAPQAVADKITEKLLGTLSIMKNGEILEEQGFKIEAVPMYNIPESENAYHTKGRGNGYVLEADGKRVYIAGDTSNTPEMRGLQNIDLAFIPMNLPYTMNVEEAAEGVLALKPKEVTPYHYRGPDGLSDINEFKRLVNAGNPDIKVTLLNFYP